MHQQAERTVAERALISPAHGQVVNKESSGLYTCQTCKVAKGVLISTACGQAESQLALSSPARGQDRGPNDPRNPSGWACL